MRLLDLFSGIGGFSLAASWAGIETVAFCEKDEYCQQVLKKHWPDVPVVRDIHELRGDEYGPVDIVSGGFPCQPFSVAGKRGGQDDDRFLWPQMLRVIKTARPTWVIGENVPGIIGLALDQVLSDLEALGYTTQTLIIPACAVDAPHRRDRVWIIAYSEYNAGCSKRRIESWRRGRETTIQNTMLGNGSEAMVHAKCGGRGGEPRRGAGPEPENGHTQLEKGNASHPQGDLRGTPRDERPEPPYGSCEASADAQGRGCAVCRSAQEQSRQPAFTDQGDVPDSKGFAKLSGLRPDEPGGKRRGRSGNGGWEDATDSCCPGHSKRCRSAGQRAHPATAGSDGWATEPGLGGMADGLPGRLDGYWPECPECIPPVAHKITNRTNRLKALGNSIVPQVAYQILKIIKQSEK